MIEKDAALCLGQKHVEGALGKERIIAADSGSRSSSCPQLVDIAADTSSRSSSCSQLVQTPVEPKDSASQCGRAHKPSDDSAEDSDDSYEDSETLHQVLRFQHILEARRSLCRRARVAKWLRVCEVEDRYAAEYVQRCQAAAI